MSRLFIFFVVVLVAVVCLRVVLFFCLPLQIADGEKISFTATIFQDPTVLGNSERFTVRLGNFWQSVPIVVQTTKNQQLEFGDRVEIIGTVKYSLLNDKKTVLAIYFPHLKAEKSGLLPLFTKFRQEITAFCENTFSQSYSGLISGMLLGVKSTLPDRIIRSFRITGVSHVVAASGMNVTLVAGFFMSFFMHFVKRKWAVLLSTVGIVGYMVLSGLSPSILRAGIMGILVFGAQLFGRQYTVVYSLFLTIGLLLFWDPLLLLDVGFQLSVLATVGIISLKPLVPLKGFLLDDVGTTLAAQVATLPVMLGTFGSYGLLSILVNALVLWTIPLITIVGGVAVTLGLISQPVGQLILWITFPLLWYFEEVVAYFADFHAVWQVGQWPIFLTVGYYLVLVSFLLLLSENRKKNSTDATMTNNR